MGGHHGETEEALEWSDVNEKNFIDILCERVEKDVNGTPTFKQSDWKKMEEDLFLKTGVRIGFPKLRGKYNRLRVKHRQFSELLEHTGVTYDTSTNIVFAAEEVWQMFAKKHRNFKTFRKNGCKHYALLGQIFGKSTATGHLHFASTQLPLNSDEERQKEDEFLNATVHVDEADTSGDEVSKKKHLTDDNLPGRSRKKKQKNKVDKIDSCLEMLATSISAKTEYNQARTQKLKEKSDEATSQINEPYSIEKCMEILDGIEDLSSKAYVKAIESFTKPDWRKIFVLMKDARRRDWLEC